MSDKKISIESVYNSKGLSEASKALKSLKKDAESVSKAFENLAKTQRGQALFSKTLSQTAMGMGKLKGVTEATSKTMKDMLGKSIETEKKKLDGLNLSIAKYNDLYTKQKQRYGSAIASGDIYGANKANAAMGRLQSNVASKSAQQQDTMAFLDSLESGPNKAKLAKMAVGITGAVLGVVAAGAGTYQQLKTMGIENRAAVSNQTAGLLSSMQGGNFQVAMAMQNPEARKAIEDAKGTKSIYLRDIATILGKASATAGAGAVGGAMAGLGVGSLPGAAVGGIGGFIGGLAMQGHAIGELFTGGPQREEAAKIKTAQDSAVANNFYQNTMADYVSNFAPAAVSAGRRLGGVGHAYRAAGLGIGLGYGGSEAAGYAGAFGGSAGAFTANESMATFFGMQKGMSTSTNGSFLGRDSQGRAVRGAGYSSMIPNFTPEAAGNLLTGMSGGAGGRADTNQSTIDFLSKAFSKGLIDARIGEELGKTVTDNLSSSGGRREAGGSLANAFASLPGAYQSQFGVGMDLKSVGETSRGFGILDKSMSSAGGASFAGTNMAIARRIIANSKFANSPNAAYMAQDLGYMSLTDQNTIGGTEGFRALMPAGETRRADAGGLLKQFREASGMSMINKLFPGAGQSGLRAQFAANHGDITQTLGNMTGDQRAEFASLYRLRRADLGADQRDLIDGALAFGGMSGALPTTTLKGSRGADKGASSELAVLVAKAANEAAVRETAHTKDATNVLLNAISDSSRAFKENFEAMKTANGALTTFTKSIDTINKIVAAPHKRHGETPQGGHK